MLALVLAEAMNTCSCYWGRYFQRFPRSSPQSMNIRQNWTHKSLWDFSEVHWYINAFGTTLSGVIGLRALGLMTKGCGGHFFPIYSSGCGDSMVLFEMTACIFQPEAQSRPSCRLMTIITEKTWDACFQSTQPVSSFRDTKLTTGYRNKPGKSEVGMLQKIEPNREYEKLVLAARWRKVLKTHLFDVHYAQGCGIWDVTTQL